MNVNVLRLRSRCFSVGLSSRIEPASEGTNSFALRSIATRFSDRFISNGKVGVARRRSRNLSSRERSRQWNSVKLPGLPPVGSVEGCADEEDMISRSKL